MNLKIRTVPATPSLQGQSQSDTSCR